jgi:hypothetical protein
MRRMLLAFAVAALTAAALAPPAGAVPAANEGPAVAGDYVAMDTDGADFLPFWTQPFGGDPANAFVRRVGLVSVP